MSGNEARGRPSRLGGEPLRKAVHLGVGGAALLLRWLTPLQAGLCALAALAFNLSILHRVTRRGLLREAERGRGFSWGIALYPAAVLALIAVFHDRLELAAAGWALLAFGDGMAGVVGRLVGGPRLAWSPRKTWAGLAAFVLWGTVAAAFLLRWTQRAALDAAARSIPAPDWVGSSFLAGADGRFPDVAWLLAGCLIAATVAAFAESLDTGIDDNVLVPLAGGTTLFLATLVEPASLAAVLSASGPALLVGAAVNGVLALGAWAARGVDRSGAVWGWALGTLLWTFGGWRGFLMLVLFFVLGTATTRVGWAKKARLGIAQSKGGRRGARNAFANTSAGVLCAFLGAVTVYPEACAVALAAAFATAACDTVSSEIGQAYGRRHVLVTTLRPVPPGTDGAVSLEGTLGGLLAAAILAGAAFGVGLVEATGAAVVVVAAFFGATVESFLGATVQRIDEIDNELVNFANTALGAGAAAALYAAW